jgi:integrase
MTCRPVLWKYYKRSDGTYALKIQLTSTFQGKTTQKYFPMDVWLHKNEWDPGICRVRLDKKPNGQAINLRLMEIEQAAEKAIMNKAPDIEKLIGRMTDPNYQAEYTPVTYFDKYIKDCKSGEILHEKTKQPLSDNYIKTFTTSMHRIEGYANKKKSGRLTFADINERFYNDFVNYLRNEYDGGKGMRENSIGTTIKRMITVFKKAKKDGHLHTNDLDQFIIITQDVDNIALTPEEIQQIISVNLSRKPHLERERFRFLVAYNFLLRYNDSISVDKKHLYTEKGRHYFRMHTSKTKEPVFIPIMPIVYDLLKDNQFKIPSVSNQKSNDNLKELGRLAGIDSDYTITEWIKGRRVETVYKRYELISTHTTRRSAATNLYKAGMDLESIRMFGGWRTIKQLMDYIKIDKVENAIKQLDHPFFSLGT